MWLLILFEFSYTAYYVAPEILSSVRYDKSCDIWALGVIMYILLCGYPPFYSNAGNKLTTGMKRRIRGGEYTFDGPGWENVSDDAKSTIKLMLTVDPEQRISIDQILTCSWLSEPGSERTIDTSVLDDSDNLNGIRVCDF